MQDVANHLNFGYFTAALLATAAVAFGAGVQFLVIGVRQRRDPTHLAFAVLCLCIATLAFSNAVMDAADSPDLAILALRILCAAAVLALPALMLFVGGYTGRPVDRYLLGTVCALSLWLFWINLRSPYGMLDTALHEAAPTVLPWGEALYTLEGTPSAWGHAFRWLSYAIFLWAMYRAARQYRDGQRLRGAMLGICLLIQFLALLWGAIVVNTLGKPYPSIDAFAFLSFVLLMSLLLASQMHSHALQLERTAS
ncbi:MAG TPA: histidine kinase N-terminal 7TM domain-containing protein, partial [Castellaniella sp.]|nr:histidine kinase N-terminal 7TM domain-containing protein [Castellaniella sp.]